MAGDWIKMRADLHTHPKVVRMSSALKADRLRIVGGLHSAWCLFDVHSVDGYLDGYSPETLDDLIGFPGFARAMIAVGWLQDEGDNLVMPRFEAHNGQSAKRRAQDADRKRNVRKVSASEEDKKRTREEKRREDLKDKPLSSAGARERPSDPKVANQIMDNRQPSAGGTGIVGKFTMFEGWRPDDDFLLKAAQWGLVLTEPPPETVLAEFITYWQAEGKVFHHVQWEQKFAQALKRNQGRYKQTGDKRDETNIRADGYSGPWRGDAVEDSIVAMAEQLRANGRSESEIRHILGGNDRDLLGQMAGEERQGTVITLESGDFSAHR